jgi:hypothetical protein
MTRWNTGLAQGNTETNELGYKSGLKRVLAFSECRTLPDFASILRLLHVDGVGVSLGLLLKSCAGRTREVG